MPIRSLFSPKPFNEKLPDTNGRLQDLLTGTGIFFVIIVEAGCSNPEEQSSQSLYYLKQVTQASCFGPCLLGLTFKFESGTEGEAGLLAWVLNSQYSLLNKKQKGMGMFEIQKGITNGCFVVVGSPFWLVLEGNERKAVKSNLGFQTQKTSPDGFAVFSAP